MGRGPGCAVLVVLAGMVCGCHRGGPARSVLVVIPKSTSTDLSKRIRSGAMRRLDRERYTLRWNAPQDEADYTRQASMVREAVEQRVAGIVLMPDHQLVLAASVQQAKEAGIPVVIANAPIALPPTEYTAFVGSNDGQIGTLAADRIGHLLHGRGEVGIVGVSPMLEGSTERERAFAERLRLKFPGITVVGTEYGLSDWARSTGAAEHLLAEFPRLEGIFASDGFATMGTIAVLRRHGPRRPMLIGVDAEVYAVDALRAGELDGVIATDGVTLGELSIGLMQAALAHEPFRQHTEVPVELLTRENVDLPEMRRYLPPPVMAPAPAQAPVMSQP